MTLAPPRLSDRTPEAEALIEEARRRQHRRRVALGLISLVAAFGVGAGVLVGGSGPRNPAPKHAAGSGEPTEAAASHPSRGLATSPPRTSSLNVLYDNGSLGTSEGYIVGSPGIELTTDGAKAWRKLSTPANAPADLGYFDDLAAIGTNDLWITMDNLHVGSINPATDGGSNLAMAIDHSTDGGRTWHLSYMSCGELCGATGLSFINAGQGFLVGSGPRHSDELYRTDNGGTTWNEVAAVPLMTDVDFVSANEGWSLSQPPPSGNVSPQPAIRNTLFRTVDGGRTWASVEPPLPPGYSKAVPTYGAPHFFNPNDGLVPAELGTNTSDGAPLVVPDETTDGGSTWSTIFPPSVPRTPTSADAIGTAQPFGGPVTVQSFGGLVSTPTASQWVLAAGDVLYTTNDAGRTWTSTREPIVWYELNSIVFSSSTTGWAVIDEPPGVDLYRTADSGKHWVLANP